MSPVLDQLKQFQRYAARRQEEFPRPGLSVSKPAPASLPRGSIEELDVLLAKRGQRQAFDRLVRTHQEAVFSVAFATLGHHEDAADVTQDTFLKAYVHLKGFRGGSSFRTWILRIALNTARSLRARERAKKRTPHVAAPTSPARRRRQSLSGCEAADPSPDSSPVVVLEQQELEDALKHAIAQLDDRTRELVIRRGLRGEPYEVIAASQGVPLGTVKSRIHRARLQLRAQLANCL